MQEVIDKIVEELESEYENLKEVYKRTGDISFYHTFQGVNKAIEIVKKEGKVPTLAQKKRISTHQSDALDALELHLEMQQRAAKNDRDLIAIGSCPILDADSKKVNGIDAQVSLEKMIKFFEGIEIPKEMVIDTGKNYKICQL